MFNLMRTRATRCPLNLPWFSNTLASRFSFRPRSNHLLSYLRTPATYSLLWYVLAHDSNEKLYLVWKKNEKRTEYCGLKKTEIEHRVDLNKTTKYSENRNRPKNRNRPNTRTSHLI